MSKRRIGAGSVRSLLLRRAEKPLQICKFIAKKDWVELADYLKTKAGRDEAHRCGTTHVEGAEGDYFLHSICRLHPPVSVVETIVKLAKPGAVSLVNKLNQAPLHIAAAHGASPQVIEFLVKRHYKAVTMQDCHGKTPLHLYCENCCSPGSCDAGTSEEALTQGPLRSVLRILCRFGISSVNVEDDDDMTPLEYCINFDADASVIRFLQAVSLKAWKKKEEMMEAEKGAEKGITATTQTAITSGTGA